MVPDLSIIFMAVSALLSFGAPIALFLVWRKKYQLKLAPLLFGAAAFIVFAMVLEQLLHMVVLHPNADGSIALAQSNPLLYMLYGIFAAGIFEETARFLSFKILKRKFSGIGTGLSYGIGHGGIEAIMLVGLTMIGSILLSISINSGNTALIASDPAIMDQIEAQVEAIAGIEPMLFLISGIERIIAIAVHISLSMLMWRAASAKGKLWLYPVSIVLHAIVNIAPVMYQTNILKNILLVEGLIIIPTILIAIASYNVCKKMQQEAANEAITTNNEEAKITNEATTPEKEIASSDEDAAPNEEAAAANEEATATENK